MGQLAAMQCSDEEKNACAAPLGRKLSHHEVFGQHGFCPTTSTCSDRQACMKEGDTGPGTILAALCKSEVIASGALAFLSSSIPMALLGAKACRQCGKHSYCQPKAVLLNKLGVQKLVRAGITFSALGHAVCEQGERCNIGIAPLGIVRATRYLWRFDDRALGSFVPPPDRKSRLRPRHLRRSLLPEPCAHPQVKLLLNLEAQCSSP